RRTQYQIRFLRERHGSALSVNLGRREDDDEPALLTGMLQHHLRAVYVSFNRSHGRLNNQLYTHSRSEVKNDVGTIDQFRDEPLVHHGIDHILKAWMLFKMDNVVNRSGRQIIDYLNTVAATEQGLGQMRADEPRASCQ